MKVTESKVVVVVKFYWLSRMTWHLARLTLINRRIAKPGDAS